MAYHDFPLVNTPLLVQIGDHTVGVFQGFVLDPNLEHLTLVNEYHDEAGFPH